jgi:hypothetical protein
VDDFVPELVGVGLAAVLQADRVLAARQIGASSGLADMVLQDQ